MPECRVLSQIQSRPLRYCVGRYIWPEVLEFLVMLRLIVRFIVCATHCSRSSMVKVSAAVKVVTACIITVLLAGCSIWPDAQHRAMNNASVQQSVAAALQQQTPQDVQCVDSDRIEQHLKQQQGALQQLSDQLQLLTAASPALAPSGCPAATSAVPELDGKTLVGGTEWIYLTPPGRHYKARIDSGAATSSLSALNIENFERNGEPWVRFDLQHDDESEAVHIEVPLQRYVRIRQASADGLDRRAVVLLTLNLGPELQQQAEFSLTDRSEMTYPILLGRSFLQDLTLIDVGRNFVQPKFVPPSQESLAYE